jgi:hypothetical protein
MTISEAQLTVDVLRGQRPNPQWTESLSSAITFLEGWIATQEVIERAKSLCATDAPRCPSESLEGNRCELPIGHPGMHEVKYCDKPHKEFLCWS